MLNGVQKQHCCGRYPRFLNKGIEFFSASLNFVFTNLHAFVENIGTAVDGIRADKKVVVGAIRMYYGKKCDIKNDHGLLFIANLRSFMLPLNKQF